MFKNWTFWRLDNQGNIKFITRDWISSKRDKPDTFWNHPILLGVIIIVCALVDFACFMQIFGKLLPDTELVRWVSILGMLFAFDFVPVYLGLNLRKRLQGYNVKELMLIAMVGVFALAFLTNVYLRISLRDLILPNLVDETITSPYAVTFAVFASILPLLTSIGSFTISYSMANPLNTEKLALETERNHLMDSIGQIDALLKEYDADGDFYDRLISDDNKQYETMKQMIREKREEYRDYVREMIKEQLGEELSTNTLSKPLKEVG